VSRNDSLLRILFARDGHFADDGVSPADQDRWRALKRHVVGMKDA
jgi:hypothetical protein